MKHPWAWMAVVAQSACGQSPTGREAFDSSVVPVLERRCAAPICHGVAPGAEASGEHVDWGQLFFRVDDNGAIADRDGAYVAAKRAIDTTEDPAFSSLLRKPLPVAMGGLGHFGGAALSGTDDPDFQTIRDWIATETGGGEDPDPLLDRERIFAERVQPVLDEATCMTSRCHGPTAGAIPYRLDTGFQGAFPTAATRHNYEQTLAMITLDGHPRMSRLVRKSQPLGPGIVHKGLNFDFYAGNPGGGLGAVVEWICAEREARTGRPCASPPEAPISAFVAVRGPVAPHHAFDLEGFTPGTDLVLVRVSGADLHVTSIENLTAGLHDVPADVREPAVSRDGRHVLFSMRTSTGQGHRVWTLDLVTREARALTSGGAPTGGRVTADRDPTWGPDGSVWFVSTRAGTCADQGRLLDADVYSLDPRTGRERRWTFTPHVERKPVFFDVGDEAGGQVAFSALRDAIPSQARAHVFRFPPSLRTEYHQHFGITPQSTFFYDMRELPDGRYACVVGDLPAPWEAGALGIVDRNLGPEVRAGALEPALERYVPPLVVLPGEGAWRDPSPLPDGRLLVAHQPGPFDPADSSATFAPRIELIELLERDDGSGPTIGRSSVVLEEAGVALTDPEPIAVRAPVRVDRTLDESDGPTALFRHQGLPLVEALLGGLAPAGVKRPLEGIATVRLVEQLELDAGERQPLGGDEVPEGTFGATSTGLGLHGPARILGEVPVEADGSFQVLVPTATPFRVEALDGAGMSIGTPHNRWYYLLAGQVLTQGTAATVDMRRYGSRCAACHGNADGTRAPAELESPDTLTGASLSLARFEHQNPRRPRAPVELGPSSRVEVDFARDVQPILDRSCASCHSVAGGVGPDLTGTPTPHFSRAYESLLRPGSGSGGGRAFVDDGDARARSSYLIELLTGEELEAPRVLPTPGTAHPAGDTAHPTQEELRTIVRWIELGATFRGTREP